MRRTIRTALDYWMTHIIPRVAFLIALAVFLSRGHNPDWLPAISSTLRGVFLIVWWDVIPAWRDRLQVDDQGLRGRLGGQAFEIPWASVVAIRLVEVARGQKALDVGARDDRWSIPLRRLSDREVWQAVQSHVRSEALEEDAFTRVPEYPDLMATVVRTVGESERPLRVTVAWVYSVLLPIGLLGMFAVGVSLGVYAVESRSVAERLVLGALSLFCTGMSILGIWSVLTQGTVEMDAQTVTQTYLRRQYRMAWYEVQTVEMDREKYGLALSGGNKRIALPGPKLWGGPDKARMIDLVDAQVHLRHLQVKYTQMPRMPRNTRVR